VDRVGKMWTEIRDKADDRGGRVAVPNRPGERAGVASPVPTAADHEVPTPAPLALVITLCSRLRDAGVSYCHWKSNDALHLSASGDNDLDLLVDRRHLQAFTEVLAACGFKQARPQRRRFVPGVLHFYGVDDETGRFVHVDAQAQLVLGDDTTKNVHLPIEKAYLASCTQGPLFPVPAPEFELAVLILRLALKHGTWDAAVFGLAPLKGTERRELEYLHARADQDELRRIVETHLSQIGWAAWSAYFRSLLDDRPLRARLGAGRRVVAGAADLMRRRCALDTAVRCRRRVEWGLRHYVLGQRNTKRLMAGGRVIAVVGGDGAGKSTMVQGLAGWLNGPLDTRVVHMGKPPRSPANLAVKGALLVARRAGLVRDWLPNYPVEAEHGGRFPGHAWLLWQLVTASDRRRQHRRARSLAGRGYLVVCDRFPLDQVTLMDGSRTRWVPADGLSLFARRLVAAEQRCYAGITDPDVLLVLRVDPDTAVARKQGVDPADFVRPRSAEVFAADWSATDAVVLDAARPAHDVLTEGRAVVWANL
jgi:thymidylate kinase